MRIPRSESPGSRNHNAGIRRVLDPIWKTKTETASRVRSRIENILDSAKAHGYREGENPAKWRGNLNKVFPKRTKVQRVVHHAAMDYAEIAAFIKHLRTQPGVGAQALEFTILTAARSGEVRGARWDEFDLEDGLWTIPAERMKAGKEHRVPLSPRAIETRKGAAAQRRLCLRGRSPKGPMSDGTLLMALERAGRGDVTTHGFRSSFRVWGAEVTQYPRDMLEFALAHRITSAVEAAYLRSDMLEKRRQLMIDWANFCDPAKESANVVSIKRAKKSVSNQSKRHAKVVPLKRKKMAASMPGS